MRVFLGAAALALAAGGCSLPCTSDAQCPPASRCDVSPVDGAGTCVRGCVPLSPCGTGGTCDALGRCVERYIDLEVTVDEPADAAALEAGNLVQVAGRVRSSGEPVALELSGIDGLGCTPVAPQRADLPAAPGGAVPFRFTGVAVGEGGGTFRVVATQDGITASAERSYQSGLSCVGCPSVMLTAPEPAVALEPHALGVVLAGKVDGAIVAPLLFSEDAAGRLLRVPLALDGRDFASRVLPVSPGDNVVGVEVAGTSGARRCMRRVTASAESASLSAHLSWEGDAADLDLAVVPPAATLGPQSCRADSTAAGCQFPTGDRRAPGPEAALLSPLSDGAYGIAVMGVPGDEGPLRASVTVLADGAVLLRAGPRMLDPRAGQVWLVARVNVGGGATHPELLDRVVATAPSQRPAAW